MTRRSSRYAATDARTGSARDQRLEVEAAVGLDGRLRAPRAAGHRSGSSADAPHAGELRRRTSGQHLDVLGGDGAVAGAEVERPADLTSSIVSAADAAARRAAVLDAVDEGHRRPAAPTSDRARRCLAGRHRCDRPARAAARPWGARPRSGSAPPSGSRTAGGSSMRAGRPVDPEHPVVGSVVGEGVDLLPGVPARVRQRRRAASVCRRRRWVPRASSNTWPGTPSESPTTSSVTSSACTASTVPHGECLDRPHERCADVGRVVGSGSVTTAAQPARRAPRR